ncbi:DUF6343 family protein [Streptomyces barkulensis]|uniref:DUF6343 family protein n=1 Tax=Streptomyces barkulensis TaxID=1257026 RepID=UPI000C6D9B4D|nr:DUF6343 family protein [Streptomyces barkulensis]
MRIPGRSRTGTEPVTARSPLGLRLLLSVVYIPVFLAGTVFFALWAADSGPGDVPGADSLRTIAWICAALTLVGVIDLIVVLVRRRRERTAGAGGAGRRGP